MNSTTSTASATARNGAVTYADSQAAALLGPRLAELLAPQEHGWQRVKSNVSRTVYRGMIDGQNLYLKHFHSRTLVHRLARVLRSYDARVEMRFSQYLREHGVPTAPVLAAMCTRRCEWLAMREVAPALPGDEWHAWQLGQGLAGRAAVQRATVLLAQLIGRMHAAGVIHRDLHCGNILVRTDAGVDQLVLTDLHRVQHRRRLSRRARAANLAQLLHDRRDWATRTDRLRFLRHYLRASGDTGSLRLWQVLVEELADGHTRRQRAQRDRRIFGSNQYFTPVRLKGGWRGHVVLASKRRMAGSKAAEIHFTRPDWQAALADVPALFAGDVEVIKDSASSLIVRRTIQVGQHPVAVYIKRSRRKKAWKLLLDCLRPARSTRAFRLGHALLARRIATALPLAALERRLGPLLLDNVLITEAVQAPPLNEFLNTWLANPPRTDTPLDVAQQRHLARQVLWQLGRLVQRLHDNRMSHRDMKASNMLVRWSPNIQPEVVLVDLDGLQQHRRMTLRRKFQGLMRMNVSLLKCPAVNRAGRLRMLIGYLRRPGSGRVDFKRYWRILEDWSVVKLKQQIRSRRKRQKAARRPG